VLSNGNGNGGGKVARVDSEANTRARRQALDAAAADLRQADWCLGVVVVGSVAAGNDDAWSDIDMRVIVAPDACDDIIARRYEITRRWGEVLFEEIVPRSNLAIVHFRPFFKMDVFYYRPADLTPSHWWLLPQMILYDPQGILADVIARSKLVPADSVGSDLRFLKTRAVAAAEEARRKMLRGQPVYAQAFLTELRELVAAIHQRKAGCDPRLPPLAYIERFAPADFRRAILDSCRGASATELEAAVKRLSALLLDLLDEADADLRQPTLQCTSGPAANEESVGRGGGVPVGCHMLVTPLQ
jgi:predicted nucleotidyltransferase